MDSGLIGQTFSAIGLRSIMRYSNLVKLAKGFNIAASIGNQLESSSPLLEQNHSHKLILRKVANGFWFDWANFFRDRIASELEVSQFS